MNLDWMAGTEEVFSTPLHLHMALNDKFPRLGLQAVVLNRLQSGSMP